MRALAATVGRLPRPAAEWLGRRLGDLAFGLLRRRRQLTVANVGRAFPELSPAARLRLGRRAWQHLGLTAVEMCALLTRPVDRFLERITIDGLEHLKAAMASPGRALLLTAHLGNWELLPAASRLAGYPLAVVVRPLDSFALNALAGQVRRRTGVALIDKRRAIRPVLETLARGGMVGILLDQNATRDEGVFVPFFGHPACTSRSIAVLAVRTGTPILPVFTRRERGGTHRITIQPPLPAPAANGVDEAVVELTARCTAVIEAAIRATPDQWLWVHRRWRTRPTEEA